MQVTTSGAVFSLVGDIAKKPTKAFEMLWSSLSKASNFYISFFTIQGITIAASVLSRMSAFFIFYLTYKYLAKTPQAMFKKWTTLTAVSWGQIMPIYTNIAVIGKFASGCLSRLVRKIANSFIGISYAVIAPLMLFWSTVGMGRFYLAYRYNVLYVTETAVDTRGLIYPRALKQLMTDVYLAEICMTSLCAVSQASWPLILMVVFLIGTVLFHITVQSALDPLPYNLLRSMIAEEESLMYHVAAVADGTVDGADDGGSDEEKYSDVDFGDLCE